MLRDKKHLGSFFCVDNNILEDDLFKKGYLKTQTFILTRALAHAQKHTHKNRKTMLHVDVTHRCHIYVITVGESIKYCLIRINLIINLF